MSWLDERLDVRPSVGRLLKEVVHTADGRFEALLPDGGAPDQPLDWAFATPQAWGLAGADDIIVERLVDALRKFPQGSCVFPDTLGTAGDPWIARLPSDYGLLEHHHGELYHYVPSADVPVEAVMRLVLWANIAWGAYGFITSGPALPATSMPARAITDETLVRLARGVRIIVARAFDNDSWVVWVRADRP